jgi:hypothetical protein
MVTVIIENTRIMEIEDMRATLVDILNLVKRGISEAANIVPSVKTG